MPEVIIWVSLCIQYHFTIETKNNAYSHITHPAQFQTLRGSQSSLLESSRTLLPCTASFPSISISILSRLLSSPLFSVPALHSSGSFLALSRLNHFDPFSTSTPASFIANLFVPRRIRASSAVFASTTVDLLFALLPPTLQASRNSHTSQL